MEVHDYKDSLVHNRSPIKANQAGRIMVQNTESNLSIKYATRDYSGEKKLSSEKAPELNTARMKLKLNTSSAVSFKGLGEASQEKESSGFTNLLRV